MNTEPHITSLLSPILRPMSPLWSGDALKVQQTGVFDQSSAASPDLLAHPRGYAPVVVEAKFEKSKAALEDQAAGRLGFTVGGDAVESVLMVLYPQRWTDETDTNISDEVSSGAECLQWAMLTVGGRMPLKGWASAGLPEIADMLEIASVSASRIQHAANTMAAGIKAAGQAINDTGRASKIAELLRQHHDPTASHEQTSRMAAMLMVNAFLFQNVLSEHDPRVPTVESLRTQTHEQPDGSLEILPTAATVRTVWKQILKVNWVPIFDVATQLVAELPPRAAPRILQEVATSAEQMLKAHLGSVQDLAGQTFGKLVADRDLLKAHYTRPEAAALLAELGMHTLDRGDRGPDWSNREAVTRLRIADFACGTGMLLSSAYRRAASRMRRKGLDDRDIHKEMIEEALVGVDVLPSAAHLTAMALSSVHPDIVYRQSNIHLARLGCKVSHTGNKIAYLGSLDMLDSKAGMPSLFGVPSEQRIAATEEETDSGEYLIKIDNGSCDLVIMNPPYGRATKHSRLTARHSGVTRDLVPPFAAFGASPEDQQEMSKRLSLLTRKIKPRAGHGNVGLASNFFDVAHAKVKPGGVVALVLPLTAATGKDWGGLRDVLASHYHDITFVALAGTTDEERQFSADTGMAELLLVAKQNPNKRPSVTPPAPDVRWVTLRRRPASEAEAVTDARLIAASQPTRGKTDALRFGEYAKGRVVAAGIDGGGLLAIDSDVVLDAAMGLAADELRLQRIDPIALPTTTLGPLGDHGKYHLDVGTHRDQSGGQTLRAPFFVDQPGTAGADPFPLLWAHDALSGRESQIEVLPDRAGTIRQGKEQDARTLFRDHAVRLHINQDFDFGSQRLAACLTPEKVLGGTAWPGYKLHDPAHEKFLALWMNTTPGLILYWLTGSRQQKRRARISVTRQHLLPVHDPRALTPEQHARVPEIYEKAKQLTFKQANHAHQDPSRERLDRMVLCDLLGVHETGGVSEQDFMDALAVVRAAWCAEPHITFR